MSNLMFVTNLMLALDVVTIDIEENSLFFTAKIRRMVSFVPHDQNDVSYSEHQDEQSTSDYLSNPNC